MKGQRALAATDVRTVFNDERIRQVLETARLKLSSDFDPALFAEELRNSACYCLQAIAEPTARQVRNELVTLYDAIECALEAQEDRRYDEVAGHLETLSERAWGILDYGLIPAPRPNAIRNSQQREKACRELYGRCVGGGYFKEGRRRANGKRSRPTFHVDFRPGLRRGRPRRDAEVLLVWGIRRAFLNAGGDAPRSARKYRSRHHDLRPGPFIRMVQQFLNLLFAPKNVSAVELLNRLYRKIPVERGSSIDEVQRRILRALNIRSRTQTDVSNLFKRHLPKDRLAQALLDLQKRGLIRLTKEKTRGAPRKVWALSSRQSPGRPALRQRAAREDANGVLLTPDASACAARKGRRYAEADADQAEVGPAG